MVNPSTTVIAKSVLAVEMSITPTIGNPVKCLISEGAKITNLKYLENGKETIVSGIVKVIKWNYIKLPESETNCVHTTKSRFQTQCQASALVMDCSSEFESDVREIPIMTVRGCEQIEGGIGLGDVSIGGGAVSENVIMLARTGIVGTVDVETGTVTDVIFVITLTGEIDEDSVSDFINSAKLTVTDTEIQGFALSDFTATFKDNTLLLAYNGELSLERVSAGDIVALSVEGGVSSIYTLTDSDLPVWEKPETPAVKLSVGAIVANKDAVEFTIVGATGDERDPVLVTLNDEHVLTATMSDSGTDDATGEPYRKYTAPVSASMVKTNGNKIQIAVKGAQELLNSDEFDAAQASLPTDITTITDSIQEKINALKAAATIGASDDTLYDMTHVMVLAGIPADQTVTGVKIGDVTYTEESSDITWSLGGSAASDIVICDGAYEVDGSDVYVNVIALMKQAAATGNVTIKVVASIPAARTARASRTIEYNVGTFDVVTAGKLSVAGVAVVGGEEGYKHEAVKTATGVSLIREDRTSQVRVSIADADGTVVNKNELVLLQCVNGTGTFEVIHVMTMGDGVLLPTDDVMTSDLGEMATSKMTATIIAPAVGSVALEVGINDNVRPALGISDVAIDGDIDYDGVVTSPEISFVTTREMDKAVLENATFRVYGTTINDTLGNLAQAVEVTGTTVIATCIDGATVDVSAIKKGGVARLTSVDEDAITDNVSVPVYKAPVLRAVVLTGEVDDDGECTGQITCTFNETIDITKMKYSIPALNINDVAIGMLSGVTNENGVVTIPVTCSVADVQDSETIEAILKRGSEEFTFVMTKGTGYPAWEKPLVLTKVELTGDFNWVSGVIKNPVIKAHFDESTSISAIDDAATVSIIGLGIRDVALVGPNAVPNIGDNAISVSLTEAVKLGLYVDKGFSATVVNKTSTQTYDMVKGTDYPRYDAPQLNKVSITGTAQSDGTIENPQAYVQVTKEGLLNNAILSVLKGSDEIVHQTVKLDDDDINRLSVTIDLTDDINLLDATQIGLEATLMINPDTDDEIVLCYSMEPDTDYPNVTSITE